MSAKDNTPWLFPEEMLKIQNEEYKKLLIQKDKEIERLNNIIKTMEKYLELIVDLGYDYDGLNSEDNLKRLIDELCRYASMGRACTINRPYI